MREQPVNVVVTVVEEETGVEYVFVGVTQERVDARVDAFLLHGEDTWTETHGFPRRSTHPGCAVNNDSS